ncbi:mucolipin [Heterostelium album PN500]|uniref:Mucolipin n=1 Tax=Heterostelium pallidum (strain ATCC 26659 / Pp 5 / PN500) TaxID=670386 RepID=D3BQQ7_HETP5|nr:mucolipin [Heterostelium album PN500]EFA76477.1 mucolipin [Heterostelium album PN500]|eukprot:XP_020428609.1 mucolipin [Heterostelium album PN500]
MSSFEPFNQSNIQSESMSLLSANINSDNEEFGVYQEPNESYWSRFVSLLKRIFLPKGEMPHDDRINMDWLQKWRKYNRFPFKLLVHLVITVCLTSIIFIQTGDLTEYSVGIEGTWYKIFFPTDFQYEGDFGANIVYLYTVQDTVDMIQNDLNNYNNFTSTSVNKFVMLGNVNSVPPFDATLYISMYKDCSQVFDTNIISANTDTVTTSYVVNSDDLGPLNLDNHTLEDLQQMFFCMESMRLRFTFSNIHLQYDHPVEYTWNVDVVFDNSVQSGRIATTVEATKTRVTDQFDPKSIALIRALGSGLPTILRFSAGSLPIFIGFALFGLMYFSETSSRFSSIGEAMVTLFGLQNGDDIQSTFRATEKSPIVSRIYFFVFVFISMYAVANIYIAIMEGAYSQCVGIKSKLQRKADEEEERRNGGGDDELNLDDEIWDKLLGLSSDSESDQEEKKRRRKKNTIRKLKNKFQTNKKLTESQILTTDRAVDALDMDSIVEDISKSILERQVEFNKDIQKLVKASIHSRIESLIQSQKLSVSNKQDDDNNNNTAGNNNGTGVSNDNNNNNNNNDNADVINFYTDPESD